MSREEKALANRRARRCAHQELHERGEDALFEPVLWTDWDVI